MAGTHGTRDVLRGRSLAFLLVGVFIGGTLLTPVSAHVGGTVGHLWRDHIRPLADKRYYTKRQANNRFFTKAQANNRFINDAAGTVGANNIADGAVNAAKIDPSQVQRRVSGTCPAGSSIRAIDATGAVTCHADSLGARTVVESSSSFNTNSLKTTTAMCPSGQIPISGGGVTSTSATAVANSSGANLALLRSVPSGFPGSGWTVTADWMDGTNVSPFSWRVIASVVCIPE